MDNQYVIHDAEKEKPVDSRSVLGYVVDGYWGRVYYRHLSKVWALSHGDLSVTVTHWTSLPPNPPKPKRWVTKQALYIGRVGMQPIFEPIPEEVRNIHCSYETPEES